VATDLQDQHGQFWRDDDVSLESWEPCIDETPDEDRANGDGASHSATVAPHAAVRAFRGDLRTIGTLELLKSLTLARASGIVSFETNPEGGVLLEDGLIVAASWGQLSGAPALARLLLLTSGPFRVGAQVREVVPGDPRAPQAMLLEALQIVAQEHRAGTSVGRTLVSGSLLVGGVSPPTTLPAGGAPSALPHGGAHGNVAPPNAGRAKGVSPDAGRASGVNAGVPPAVLRHGAPPHAVHATRGTGFVASALDAPGESRPTGFVIPPIDVPGEPPATSPVTPPTMSPAAPSAMSPVTSPAISQAAPMAITPAAPSAIIPAAPVRLRSKSLWWTEVEPREDEGESASDTFAGRALHTLRGARTRLFSTSPNSSKPDASRLNGSRQASPEGRPRP
jgi:hypothetical protein